MSDRPGNRERQTSIQAPGAATQNQTANDARVSIGTFSKEYLASCCPEELLFILAIKDCEISRAEHQAALAKIDLEERMQFIKDSVDFEWDLYGSLVDYQAREKQLKDQFQKQSKELHDLTLQTNEWKKKCDLAISENLKLKKSHEMTNGELKEQLDTKDAKLREIEEELKQHKLEKEELLKEIENNKRAAEQNTTADMQPDEDEMDEDAMPIVDIMSESDANDEDYEPHEAFSRKTAGLSRIKKETGVKTRNQHRETRAPMEIGLQTAVVKRENENTAVLPVPKTRTVKKEPYPQRLCSNPIAAINESQNLRDPRLGAVIPFTVPHPPEFQKRSTTKRKLMSRSGSGSAAVGDPDDVDDEEARSKARSAKKGWQASVK